MLVYTSRLKRILKIRKKSNLEQSVLCTNRKHSGKILLIRKYFFINDRVNLEYYRLNSKGRNILSYQLNMIIGNGEKQIIFFFRPTRSGKFHSNREVTIGIRGLQNYDLCPVLRPLERNLYRAIPALARDIGLHGLTRWTPSPSRNLCYVGHSRQF